jgi:hypothetical protein
VKEAQSTENKEDAPKTVAIRELALKLRPILAV